jgi:hypothetical protein
MADQLKPLSDMERLVLKALGEDPEKHQQRVAMRMKGVRPPAQKPDKILQKLQDGTAEIVDSTSANIVRQWVEPVWVPEAYIIFIRHSTCKNCGRKDICQEDQNVYLKSRSNNLKDESNPKRYQPVRSMDFFLPRRLESKIAVSLFCSSCFATSTLPDHTGEKPTSTLAASPMTTTPQDSPLVSAAEESGPIVEATMLAPLAERGLGGPSTTDHFIPEIHFPRQTDGQENSQMIHPSDDDWLAGEG